MKFKLFFLILLSFCAQAQEEISIDTIVIDGSGKNLNKSIAHKFTIYEADHGDPTVMGYTDERNKLKKRKLENSVENLVFTTSYYFIHFVIINKTDYSKLLYLETARPITNTVSLLPIYDRKTQFDLMQFSGDGIPFSEKSLPTNRSVLPIYVDANDEVHCILTLGSDGEIISLPMIFWEDQEYQKSEQQNQFFFGVFYGIFLFVIIIYLTFYTILRDRLFLFYTIYVAFSGMLQFALDGYVHQYIFTSGGYMTQHSLILIAGGTVFFAFMYAMEYLNLSGRWKKASLTLASAVLLTMIISLIPGDIYELCYPLINGFSFLTIVFLLIAAIYTRRTNKSISILFLFGLGALLIAGFIFILGNFSVIDIPNLTQNSLKAGTLVEILCLSILMAGKYKSLQEEKEAAQKQLVVQLEETNIRLEQEVAERTKEIEKQRILLKEKNDDLISSIKYAERIQTAILPHEQKFSALLPDSFVLYKPKDIVSGDFYWIEEIEATKNWPNGLIVYATADCTGHGVPGAFVSIVCSNLLKLGKLNKHVQTTGQTLDFVNREINTTLNSEYNQEEIRDGMDIALCAIDPGTKKLYFSGAKNGIYILRGDELLEYKGDRKAIGNSGHHAEENYSTETIQLTEGDTIYSFTDGIVDQFGGPNQKKFMSRRFKDLLLKNRHLSMNAQKTQIEKAFTEWKGREEQVDDILIIGVRI